MTQVFSNGGFSTLAAGINDTVTQLSVGTGEGARFPGVGGNDDFCVLTITQAGPVETSFELVKLVSRATDTFTVVRGWDNTTPQSWPAGSKVELRQSADNLNVLNALLPKAFVANDLGNKALKIVGAKVNDNFEYVVTRGEQWEQGYCTVDNVVFTEPLDNPYGDPNGNNASSQWNMAVNNAYVFKFSGDLVVRHSLATGLYIDSFQNTNASNGSSFGQASNSLLIMCRGYGYNEYYTSTNNGVSWTSRTFTTWYPGWDWLEYDNGLFYFISANDNYVYWTSDGISWSRHTGMTFANYIKPVYFKGYWYAISNVDGYVYRATSLNGTWAVVWNDIWYETYYRLSVVKNNTRLLLVSYNIGDPVYYSDDGTTKTSVPDPFGIGLVSASSRVAGTKDFCVVQAIEGVSTDRVFYITNDGVNWSPIGPGFDIHVGGFNSTNFAVLSDANTLMLGATYAGTPDAQLYWTLSDYYSGNAPRRPTHGSDTLPVVFDLGRSQVRARSTDSNGTVIQVKREQITGHLQFTSAIPADNTIPQNTEGTLVLSCNIAPKRANSKLVIEVEVYCAGSTAGSLIVAALFAPAYSNDALAVSAQHQPAANYLIKLAMRFEVLAGSTVARSYHVRLGSSGGSVTFNGSNNTPYYGGSLISHLTVTEIGG